MPLRAAWIGPKKDKAVSIHERKRKKIRSIYAEKTKTSAARHLYPHDKPGKR
jgi:hypothetical protein